MKSLVTVTVLVLLVALVACGKSNVPGAQERTTDVAAERSDIYEPVNFVDFNNWNDWATMSDNPSTILWCTFFPFGHEKITVPIVGKFTDSGKTPFPTKFQRETQKGNSIEPSELADPFAMYGTSSEFQYGFDPVGNFTAFSASIPWTCNTEPKIYQSVDSTIVVKADGRLAEISARAQAALEAGDDAGAIEILQEAEE